MELIQVCPECGRRFDLTDAEEADEYHNGHDCEEYINGLVQQAEIRYEQELEDWAEGIRQDTYRTERM